nr:MAG TPA: hypothetical protein [Bacteriophage sp.]
MLSKSVLIYTTVVLRAFCFSCSSIFFPHSADR